jgi:hypothetical protein
MAASKFGTSPRCAMMRAFSRKGIVLGRGRKPVFTVAPPGLGRIGPTRSSHTAARIEWWYSSSPRWRRARCDRVRLGCLASSGSSLLSQIMAAGTKAAGQAGGKDITDSPRYPPPGGLNGKASAQGPQGSSLTLVVQKRN